MTIVYAVVGSGGEKDCSENNNLKSCLLVWVPWEIDTEEMIQIKVVYLEEDFRK